MAAGLPFGVVAVASSKGGTGKSTICSNLVLELRRQGVDVGLLDADIDSPYMAEILGVKRKIDLDSQRRMVPVDWNGVPFMSFAAFHPDEFAGATMSGQMHSQWIGDAMMEGTDWRGIRLLVIDLPAGTSSEEYVHVRKVAGERFLGLVAVAQPNVVTGLLRLYNTASFNHMRILGVVENMSGPHFGAGTVADFCMEKGLVYCGSVPLDPRIRVSNEHHQPGIPEDLMTPIRNLAQHVMMAAGVQPRVREARV